MSLQKAELISVVAVVLGRAALALQNLVSNTVFQVPHQTLPHQISH